MIVSLSLLRSYLGIVGSEFDTQLEQSAMAAQGMLETLCGRKFEQATYEESFRGLCDDPYFIRNFPASFPSLGSDFSSDFYIYVNGNFLESYDDFLLMDEFGELELVNRIFCDRMIHKIKYRGGFAVVPAEIKQAILEGAKILFETSKNAGIASESMGDVSVSYLGGDAGTRLQTLPSWINVSELYCVVRV